MQIRFACELTGEDYVSQKAWRQATLKRCPLHPQGGCGFKRHGTYERLRPAGARVARWYCLLGHCTFSALPDCLAARFSGTLAEVEAVVVALEQAPSQEAAAESLRPDVELPGVLRWARRRLQRVHGALHLLRALMPERFEGLAASPGAWRAHLKLEPVLPALREIAAAHLTGLPAPLGFKRRLAADGEPRSIGQQPAGPDPPWHAR